MVNIIGIVSPNRTMPSPILDHPHLTNLSSSSAFQFQFPYSFPFPFPYSFPLNSTIMKRDKEDVFRADRDEFVHDDCALFLLHHRANSTPAVVLDRADCRRSSAWCDREAFREEISVDVVLGGKTISSIIRNDYALKQKRREKCCRLTATK